MVEVNGAYKYGKYAKNWLKSLHAMSNVEVFATEDGWQPTHLPDKHD